MKTYFLILLSAVLVNNFVLVRFLGICPFIGVSKKTETAIGMGLAVTFVMLLSGIVTYLLNVLFLSPTSSNLIYKTVHIFNKNIELKSFDFSYMQTVIFILVIATLVQLVEMIIKKYSNTLYQSLGIFLPLITTNCAVLGVALLNIQKQYSLIETIIHSLGAALGFTLALVIMSGLREKFEVTDIPPALKGVPIALITAGILSLCFMGFSGITN